MLVGHPHPSDRRERCPAREPGQDCRRSSSPATHTQRHPSPCTSALGGYVLGVPEPSEASRGSRGMQTSTSRARNKLGTGPMWGSAPLVDSNHILPLPSMARPQTIVSDDDDDDTDFEYADQPPSTVPAKAPAKAPAKPRATATKAAAPVAAGRIRKPSQKQAAMNKENDEDLARANARLRKQLKAFKNAGIVPQEGDNDNDNELESEDGMEDEGPDIGASGRIRPLENLPQPPEKPARLRQRVPGGKKVAKVRRLLSAPEPTPEQMQLDSQATPPSSPRRLDTQDPEQEPVATDDDMPIVATSSSPAAAAAARRGKRPATSDTEAPPAKRAKDVRQPRFRDGVPPTGKPKASQYDATDGAVILRACQTFSCKVLAVTAVPDNDKLAEMVKVSWKDGCRVARERVDLTHHVRKIIEARLPQVRGKVVDAFRSLVSVCFELERSKSLTVIEANKKIVEDLLREPMSFHYKDTKTRTGFGENKIFVQARRLAHFRSTESLAIRYPSTFNPLPVPFLALEFAALEFALGEWETGSHVASKFTEKDISDSYQTHLADITRWTKINPETTLKLREKWYTRASATLEGEEPVAVVSASLGAEEEAALRAQLESRTGDTDSENENEQENDEATPQ
ncbi:hypothetical protein HMN09_00361700 [Mycena chlorophos]|uniref:DUF6532 domain-containing protein n=1 Tax=Mycena chlorophos TaxID=658473 RepID=A0A8H6TIU6_MYCCL|nr:hypothetical protein HMN09_00361700 [Mycena chlorophos]